MLSDSSVSVRAGHGRATRPVERLGFMVAGGSAARIAGDRHKTRPLASQSVCAGKRRAQVFSRRGESAATVVGGGGVARGNLPRCHRGWDQRFLARDTAEWRRAITLLIASESSSKAMAELGTGSGRRNDQHRRGNPARSRIGCNSRLPAGWRNISR